jgi:4-amino-4-deoxy-L-arabinose transferase-like glycosyltransferase
MSLEVARARRVIAVAAVAGFVLRLGFGVVYWTEKPLTHDEREYLDLAASLAAGNGFVYTTSDPGGTSQQFGRAPGYPLFLAAIGVAIGAGRAEADHTPLRVKVAQSIVGGLIVVLIGALAYRAGGPPAGRWAAAIAAVYPPLVTIPSYVLSETLFSAVALAAALVLQRSGEHDDGAATRWAALAGVLTGAAALIRPAMLFFLPLAALWLVVRRRTVSAVMVVLATAVVITPWTLRNIRVYDRLVVIASEGGITFWTGNHPLSRGEGDLAANPEIKRAELEFRRAHAGLTPDEMEPLYYRDAFRTIGHDPIWWVSLLIRKAFYLAVPIGPSYGLHSTRYRVASAVPYLLLLPFAIIGGQRLWRGAGRPSALMVLAGSAVLVCLIFFPQERFRIPVIDPTLIVCASGMAVRCRP